jgi:hypothetical protein
MLPRLNGPRRQSVTEKDVASRDDGFTSAAVPAAARPRRASLTMGVGEQGSDDAARGSTDALPVLLPPRRTSVATGTLLAPLTSSPKAVSPGGGGQRKSRSAAYHATDGSAGPSSMLLLATADDAGDDVSAADATPRYGHGVREARLEALAVLQQHEEASAAAGVEPESSDAAQHVRVHVSCSLGT